MEHNQYAAQERGALDAPNVLLAGFPRKESDYMASALRQMAWNSIALSKEEEIEAVFTTQRFDITFIDAEHIEVYAPHFIQRLRKACGPSSDTTIIAVDSSDFVGFKDQLVQSGADLVVPKPTNPKRYLINFTRAAAHRLQITCTPRPTFTEFPAVGI